MDIEQNPEDLPQDKLNVKNKVRQLFRFLKEANQLRFRPIRQVNEHPRVIKLSEMPNHQSVQIFRPIKVEKSQEVPEVLLKIKRPTPTKCPDYPSSLAGWLLPNWDDPEEEVAKVISKNESIINEDKEKKTVTIFFEDSELRVAEFTEWLVKRDKWKSPELLARDALNFFEKFYDIYSIIEKDGENLELIVADGVLNWQTVSSVDGSVKINHPVLFKRVELLFDSKIPEFTVHETEKDSELYSNLFLDLTEIDPRGIRNRTSELSSIPYHPLGWDDTEAFLKALIQTISPVHGRFIDHPENSVNKVPVMFRDSMLILRQRTIGVANAVDAILDNIETKTIFSSALSQITGCQDNWGDSEIGLDSNLNESFQTDGNSSVLNNEETEILLAKEANEEQIQIIRRLEQSGSVIVQGPPGTGKTHTIGNLIGHLLANGKSILVTAHTAKALRVLRDKVPDLLKPLCVSVLGSDQTAKRQLEASIGAIAERLTTDTSESLLKKAVEFSKERKQLIKIITELNIKLRNALENEYKPISINEKKISPSDAAREVQQYKNVHNWIDEPVQLGANINLNYQEISRLYSLGVLFDDIEEQDALRPLPELKDLPTEQQFELKVNNYQNLLHVDVTKDADKWKNVDSTSEKIEQLIQIIQKEFSDELRKQAWRPYAIIAGMHGSTDKIVWERLILNIQKTCSANSKYNLVLHHRPRLSDSINISKQFQIITEICCYIDAGGKMGFVQLATRSEWRNVIKSVSIIAGKPSHREHFEAVRCLAELELNRLELEDLWDNLIGQFIDSKFNSLGPNPEFACRALIPEIQKCLEWFTSIWKPISSSLLNEGLDVENLISLQPRQASQTSEYLLIEKFTTESLITLLINEERRRRLKEYELKFKQLEDFLINIDPSNSNIGSIYMLISAVRSKDTEKYRTVLKYINRLHTIYPLVVERNKYIEKLELVAPGWANQIKQKSPPHDKDKTPGDVDAAWSWRQLHDQLKERDKLDATQIQLELEKQKKILRELTLWLIDASAWGNQLKRLQGNNSIRQALVGWLDTTKRLLSTRQIDRRQTLLRESRKLMKQCSEAVPVWIMPISIMAESFDPRSTQFDVVIIDEASQADLNALIPVYMGKKIIVVGDHEQVTPLGVGKSQTILENLRTTMLEDIPNSHLFDNMSSIYDIARQSFGNAIRLVEHFRCVPEIISFSNALSYEGKIRPLRESNSTKLKPACISVKVDGVREGDTNKLEAQRIIKTINAMIKHPIYENKSIGIISMVGESQAYLIQSMIHTEISSIEIEKRRIQAGISREFQGDERDVIFLSFVDSIPEQGLLRTTGDGAFEQTRKRYNVAVSRARDQLWVIHSFDPDRHLNSADLRFKLLKHVKNPLSSIEAFESQVSKSESPFEREVLKRLTAAGFVVKTQWQVGYFRIDMVVEGGGKRLAVECDGDRYHPIEKLAEDMERQIILERLGWQFVRIRGSSFYRDPDSAMHQVFKRLEDLEIFPQFHADSSNINERDIIQELDQMILRAEINKVIEHDQLFNS